MGVSIDAFTQRLVQDEQVQSVLVLQHPNRWYQSDSIDLLYLIIDNGAVAKHDVQNLIFEDKSILAYRISQWQLETCAMQGSTDERILLLLLHAEIVSDKFNYARKYRERLQKGTHKVMKCRICEEYSGFLQHYMEAKELLLRQLTLDAYQAVIHALQRWARLVIYEAGELPELSLWTQVKQKDPAVYKLYEELTTSTEPLEKRVELMLLPIEVNVLAKLKGATQCIVDIMQTENRPWFLHEMIQHPELSKRNLDLQLLMEKMAKRSMLYEVAVLQENGQAMEKGYLLSL
ncbi:MAG: nucleotidyltransferase-like protein [Clostridia bacterium]